MKKLSVVLMLVLIGLGITAQAAQSADCALKNMRNNVLRGDTRTNFVPANAQLPRSNSNVLQDVTR